MHDQRILCGPCEILGLVPVWKRRGGKDEFCLQPWLPCKANQLACVPSAGEIQINKICSLILTFNIGVLSRPFHCDVTAEEIWNFILL
jgi:hypothetical protein